MKYVWIICFLICTLSKSAFTQSTAELKMINQQVWKQFYQAFEQLDHQYMASIHSKDLVRVPANSNMILGYQEYIDNYEKTFSNTKASGETRSIELRFLERIVDRGAASERGIYQLTINKDTPSEKKYYGKFHVILRKEAEIWKILVDYDSDEGSTIGKENFEDAYAIDDFDYFLNQK